MIISIKSGSWGGNGFWVDIEIWVVNKGGTKEGQKEEWMGEEVWGLLGFVALVCVWMYFHCSSGWCCVRDCRVWGVYG
jgi:hypothetical protein